MPKPPAQSTEQLELLFDELSFPGQQTITVAQVAERFGFTVQHIINLCDDPECALVAIDGGRRSRGAYRIPISAYTAWIFESMTSEPRENPIFGLDTAKFQKLWLQMATRLEIRGACPFKLLQSAKR